ncbi:MAG: uroporphyrinogen decarboxylase family protein [Candidatus Helarchaeota archaeon]
MKNEMTSIERVETTLRFEEPDRVPIFFPLLPLNIITPEDSLRIGKDWKKLVEINDAVIKKYGVDVVHVHSHQFTFAEALGLKIKYRPDFLPCHGEIFWPNNYVLDTAVDPMNPDTLKELIDRIEFTDWLEFPTITTKLKAIKVLKEKYPDIPLMGEVDDPVTLLACLVGVSRFTVAITNSPIHFLKFSEKILPHLMELVKLQVEAGIDMLFTLPTFFGTSIADTTIRDRMVQIMKPLIIETTTKFKKAGAKYIMSHICMNSIYLIDLLEEIGKFYNIDIMWIAESADYGTAKRMANGAMTITGGPHSYKHFVRGTPRQMEQVIKYIIGQAAPGGGFILSPADEAPFATPQVNIDTFISAAKKWGKYPIAKELTRTSLWDL